MTPHSVGDFFEVVVHMGKSKSAGMTDYGRDMGNDRANRFSMNEKRTPEKDNGRRNETVKHTNHLVWHFEPGDHMLVPGEIIKDYESPEGIISGHAFNFAMKKPDGSREEFKDIIPVSNWDERSPIVDGVTLKSLNYPNIGGRDGIVLFIHLPAPGNVRMFRPSDEYKNVTEFRADFLGAEIAYQNDDQRRQQVKRSIRKPFVFPGADGERLEQQGVKRIWPVFADEEQTKTKVYNDHCLVIGAGVEIEIIMEYTAGTVVSNYYSVRVGQDLIPVAFNVREENGPDMIAARSRAAQITNAGKVLVEDRRKKF